MANEKERFARLSREAAACRLCPRMADQPAVLGPKNGPLDADTLFVAEAPGRFGAGRTGIPFSGDRSGENFESLLSHIRLGREDVFITNAALCNPLQDGKNSRPTAREIGNCSYYLRSVLDIIQPRVVVTLGGVGLDAINRLLNAKYHLSKNAARPLITPEFKLLPLYHPSPRVTNWKRPLDRQRRDFKKILNLLKSETRTTAP